MRARLAGPGQRFSAWLLDLTLQGFVFFLFVLSLGLLSSVGFEGLTSGFSLLFLFLLNWFYFVLCESLTGGRSPGKKALGLRVVCADGRALGLRESLIRNLLRAADFVMMPPYALVWAPFVMTASKKFQRLGDIAAQTVVVYEPKTRLNVERALAPTELAVELPRRIPLSSEEAAWVDEFVHRKALSSARREELAGILAEPLARALAVPRFGADSGFIAAVHERMKGASS